MAYSTGAYKTPTDYNFVSSLDMQKPDNDPNLVMSRGKQTLYGLLSSIGSRKETRSLEYNSWQQDWIMPKVKASCTGGAAGAAVTFTIHADARLDVGTTPYSPYVSTQANVINPVRVNDLILIKP